MNRHELIELLQGQKQVLTQAGVKSLARGEGTPDNDIDILVAFPRPGGCLSLSTSNWSWNV